MYKKTTMSSKMTSKLQQYQEDFYDEVFDFFGKDIIGSDTHPLKAAFNLYVEMKKDQETDDEEDQEDEEEEYIYTYYKCEHCGFATGNDDPDCSKCKEEMCMMCIQNCESEEEEEEVCKNCDETYTGCKEPYCIMGQKNCGKGLPHITVLYELT